MHTHFFNNKYIIGIISYFLIFNAILVLHSQATLTAPKTILAFGSINVALSRLHTDGRWIKDASESIIRLKGACIHWRFQYASSYHDYDPLAYDDNINEDSIGIFKNAGGNFLRLTVNGYLWHIAKKPKYIAAVDTVVQWCKARGIMVVFDNHIWWNPDTDSSYFSNREQISELESWKAFMVALAERYNDEPTVIGLDVLNEPLGWPPEDISWNLWWNNVLEVVRAIHAVDSTYLCFVEPLGSSANNDDIDHFKNNPLPEPNIVYSAHKYYCWDYPYQPYAIAYAEGRFEEAKDLMEALYYEYVFDMIDVNLPVIMMESGVYKDPARNPNALQWETDVLDLYSKYQIGTCWWSFDPDRAESSITSLLKQDRSDLTEVGQVWAEHLAA